MKRPVLRYHGGKWLMAPWIIEHMPTHAAYVECFGGGASVLLRKPRVQLEVYNDLDERAAVEAAKAACASRTRSRTKEIRHD